ncbi:MAG TPA: flagellar export chaperone FliS [Casimicrobiaceae bacterium]|nr:flagellar export chaperone FliS [Casimicrobiaceae bacterium]
MLSATSAAKAYARIGLETGVAAASPQALIVMLYDGALGAIADAKAHLLSGQAGLKGRALGKAIAIVGEGLRASLDTSRGGAIAQQLADLYDYVERRLFQANVDNDAAALDEVALLLADLRGAWATLAAQGPSVTASSR